MKQSIEIDPRHRSWNQHHGIEVRSADQTHLIGNSSARSLLQWEPAQNEGTTYIQLNSSCRITKTKSEDLKLFSLRPECYQWFLRRRLLPEFLLFEVETKWQLCTNQERWCVRKAMVWHGITSNKASSGILMCVSTGISIDNRLALVHNSGRY